MTQIHQKSLAEIEAEYKKFDEEFGISQLSILNGQVSDPVLAFLLSSCIAYAMGKTKTHSCMDHNYDGNCVASILQAITQDEEQLNPKPL